MRKVKSTALLGAFVAVASLGAISHEAHAGSIVLPNYNTVPIISKELLPSPEYLEASIVPSVSLASGTIKLSISGASFLAGQSYTISGASCSITPNSNTDTLLFSGCDLNASSTYPIAIVGSSSFQVTIPTSSNSIVLSYDTNTGDASTSIIAYVKQQLTVTPANAGTAFIDPSSLSIFLTGNYASSSTAFNTVSILNNAYGNTEWTTTPSQYIDSSTMIFSLTGIPGSVSSVSVSDFCNNFLVTPGNGSATISTSIANRCAPFQSYSTDITTFTFYNSGNIQPGTIVLSSITGVSYNSTISAYVNYPYLSTPQNFLEFVSAATQIYVPDALAPSGTNVIQSGYIAISMPSSASIASISVLNNPSASCPAPSTSNGLLTSTSSTGVYYINLRQLAQACIGLSASAWQSGVPLVINISGTDATPNNITADAYATFNNMLKRIPVDVLNSSNVNDSTHFSY